MVDKQILFLSHQMTQYFGSYLQVQILKLDLLVTHWELSWWLYLDHTPKFGNLVGTYECHLSFFECRCSNCATQSQWGRLHPTCLTLLHSDIVARTLTLFWHLTFLCATPIELPGETFTSWYFCVISVTNYYSLVNSAPWLAARACSLSSPEGDSSCSWVLVRALGHNFGREWGNNH